VRTGSATCTKQPSRHGQVSRERRQGSLRRRQRLVGDPARTSPRARRTAVGGLRSESARHAVAGRSGGPAAGVKRRLPLPGTALPTWPQGVRRAPPAGSCPSRPGCRADPPPPGPARRAGDGARPLGSGRPAGHPPRRERVPLRADKPARPGRRAGINAHRRHRKDGATSRSTDSAAVRVGAGLAEVRGAVVEVRPRSGAGTRGPSLRGPPHRGERHTRARPGSAPCWSARRPVRPVGGADPTAHRRCLASTQASSACLTAIRTQPHHDLYHSATLVI
jgi:hypothetical protein